jgi:hypothetical protein
MNGRQVRMARRAGAEAGISLCKRRTWCIDVTQTAANVRFGTNAIHNLRGKSGAAIAIGQPVYRKSSDGLIWPTDADAQGDFIGWAFESVPGAGQELEICTFDDDFTSGFTMTKNGVYVPSATAGGIAPVADVTTGWYGMWGIFAKSTTKALLLVHTSGVAV